MLRFLIFLFLAYLLYRFIAGFLIPVYRTTRQVKKGFREMQEKMNEELRRREQERAGYQQATSQKQESRHVESDYIDFEEIK